MKNALNYCLLSLITLIVLACDVNGPWEYEPLSPDAAHGVSLYGFLYENKSVSDICFDKTYQFNEVMFEGLPFYDSAHVTLTGLFAKSNVTEYIDPEKVFHSEKYPLILTPNKSNANCFESTEPRIPIASQKYVLQGEIYWDSMGIASVSRLRSEVSVPKAVRLRSDFTMSRDDLYLINPDKEYTFYNYHNRYSDSAQGQFLESFYSRIQYLSPDVDSYCRYKIQYNDINFISVRKKGDYNSASRDRSVVPLAVPSVYVHRAPTGRRILDDSDECPNSVSRNKTVYDDYSRNYSYSPGKNSVILYGYSKGYESFVTSVEARGSYNYGGDIWTNVTGGSGIFVGVAVDSMSVYFLPDSAGHFPYIDHYYDMWDICSQNKEWELQDTTLSCQSEYPDICEYLNNSTALCTRNVIYENLIHNRSWNSVEYWASQWISLRDSLDTLIADYNGIQNEWLWGEEYKNLKVQGYELEDIYTGKTYLNSLHMRHLEQLDQLRNGQLFTEAIRDSAYVEYCLSTDFPPSESCIELLAILRNGSPLDSRLQYMTRTCRDVEWYPGCGRVLMSVYQELLKRDGHSSTMNAEVKNYCATHQLSQCDSLSFPYDSLRVVEEFKKDSIAVQDSLRAIESLDSGVRMYEIIEYVPARLDTQNTEEINIKNILKEK